MVDDQPDDLPANSRRRPGPSACGGFSVAQQPPLLVPHDGVALAARLFEAETIANHDQSPPLADQARLVQGAQDQRDRRAVHAERANARLTLKVLTGMVIAEFAVGVLAPAYSAPYATPTGQVVLAVFSAVFIGLLLLARKCSLPRRPSRILTLDAGGVR